MIFKYKIFVLMFGLTFLFCQEMPNQPASNNPLDMNNPQTQGNPFLLKAEIANGGVTLNWSAVNISTVEGYYVYRSIDQPEKFEKTKSTTREITTCIDSAVVNGHSYWYKVTAHGNDGEESSLTNVAAVRISTEPVLVINGGAEFTGTRQVQLTILATGATQLWISNVADFSEGNWEAYVTEKSWTLSTGPGLKIVYMKTKYADETESPISTDSIAPLPMNPNFEIAHGAQYTATRNVIITGQVSGENIQIKLSEDSTFFNIPWQSFRDSLYFHLSSQPQMKTVFAKFKNDFEIESLVLKRQIIPQNITTATIRLNNSARYTAQRDVQLALEALGAEFMKVSEDSSFTNLAWQNFSANLNFRLSAGEGQKMIYAQFITEFQFVSPLIVGTIILDQTPPQARFIVLPDSGITQETSFSVNATASGDNFTPNDQLEVRWDWENDSRFDTPWSLVKKTNFIYQTGGSKTIQLEVRDGAGLTQNHSRQIFVNTRPQAQFSISPRAGETTTLFQMDARASADPDGHSIWLRWDFEGDGQWDTEWSQQKTMSHQFSEGGNFRIVLQVKDQFGLLGTSEQAVVVFYHSPMVVVPAGEFTMGSPDGFGDADEQPQHVVTLAEFQIDQYEVTNLQYAQFLSLGHEQHYHPKMKIVEHENGIYIPEAGYEKHPVVYVSYENALAYARWQGKSLPTEAQWEKAARGIEMRVYPWGNGLENANLNYWNSGDPFETTFYPPTTPVGYYNGSNWNGYQTRGSHSPYGAYDLAGNVAEWCLDWYQPDYYQPNTPPDPVGPATGTHRVVRGGSWADDAYHVRSAARSHHPPFEPSPFIGFRCVKQDNP